MGVSFHITRVQSGCSTETGDQIESIYEFVLAEKTACLGLEFFYPNASRVLEKIRSFTDIPIAVFLSAYAPGETIDMFDRKLFCQAVQQAAESGALIIGGGAGTAHRHCRLIHRALADMGKE